jgi:hypothetical protein
MIMYAMAHYMVYDNENLSYNVLVTKDTYYESFQKKEKNLHEKKKKKKKKTIICRIKSLCFVWETRLFLFFFVLVYSVI